MQIKFAVSIALNTHGYQFNVIDGYYCKFPFLYCFTMLYAITCSLSFSFHFLKYSLIMFLEISVLLGASWILYSISEHDFATCYT
jgi:hypothetical protein